MGLEAPADYKIWNNTKPIHKFFGEIVKRQIGATTGFKAFEKVSGFYVMHKEFEKGKEMTETMKIKRNVVFDLYKKEIDHLYHEDH